MNAGKACAFIREAVRLVFRGREMEKSVIFDVDGTLWDSSEAVTESWNEVLSRYPGCRKAPLTREDMYRYMGHTMEEIGRMMLPGLLQEERCRIMEECMQHENAYLALHSGSFYPGTVKALRKLREEGIRLYIVSNCQKGYIETLLHCGGLSLGEEGDFQDIECFGNTGKGKGENIAALMERNRISRDRAFYVGDTVMDERAARSAGIPFIHAAYGFGEAEEPAARLCDIRELPELLKSLVFS